MQRLEEQGVDVSHIEFSDEGHVGGKDRRNLSPQPLPIDLELQKKKKKEPKKYDQSKKSILND